MISLTADSGGHLEQSAVEADLQNKQICTALLFLQMASCGAMAGNRHQVIINGGMVHLRGVLTEAACSVSIESQNQTVNMGMIRSNQFSGLGSYGPPVAFNIHLTECSVAVSNTVGITFFGVADGKDPQVLKTEMGENSANGIGLALFDRHGEIIQPNTAPRSFEYIHEGDNSLRFIARYRATSREVVGGSADVSAWFTLTYQ